MVPLESHVSSKLALNYADLALFLVFYVALGIDANFLFFDG